ncbi:MAG: proliferating cell nuclear antigen (pcna) [Candidatus Woesearchaeota archaeon]
MGVDKMKLTLAEPKYLRDSVLIISELVNEVRFKITAQAIELVAMDPANVAMVIYKLFSSCFTEYDVKKPTEIAINLSNLKQILKRIGPNDTITIEVTNENKLQIQIRGGSTRTFSVPIIDFEEKEQKIPDLNFGTTITTPCSVFNSAIEDAGIVAESVTFIADDKKFTIQAEGDLSKAKIEIKGDDTKIAAKTKDTIKAKYSIEYLKKMLGGSKLAENVEISFSNDYPLKLEYKVIDRIQLGFILAPRVESD